MSSTRLRAETRISIPTHVFFGDEDENKPCADWISNTPTQSTRLEKAGHAYYRDPWCTASRQTRAVIARHLNQMARARQ